ncbi:MAG: DUF2087 domain-containing protein [Chloroflexi bacterium]|nr:DUF2087 domain-containing protein [Chloroflexota bacterium]
MSAESDLTARAQLFKALGHPARLLMVNLIRSKPRHGEELAAILNLQPGTISHHLGQLSEVGLITAVKDQYYQVYSLAEGVWQRSLADLVQLPLPDVNASVEADAYRDKVLKTFFLHGQLKTLPAQLKKQQIVLEKIAEAFEIGRDYSEKEVNFVLLDFHEDVAALRRGLIEHGLMTRERGVYRKP